MTPLGDQINAVIQDHLKPLLQAHGFRKSGRTFWRNAAEQCDVVDVQLSRWNSATEAQFTLNLGVYWHAAQQALGMEATRIPPEEYECTVRARLSALVTSGRDHWWRVEPMKNPEEIGHEITAALKDHGLPWLEHGHYPETSIEYARRSRLYIQAAALSLVAGDAPQAQAFIAKAWQFQPLARDRIEEVASRLGISW